MNDNRITGNLGESYAARLLKKKGYKIIAKNFRSRYGEIDIIAKDGETYVFIEVKTRNSEKYGKPEEAVTPTKLVHIKTTAEYFLIKNNILSRNMRIEVVAISFDKNIGLTTKVINVV